MILLSMKCSSMILLSMKCPFMKCLSMKCPNTKVWFQKARFFFSFFLILFNQTFIYFPFFLLDLETSAFLFKQSFDYPLPSPSTYQFQNICIAGSRRDWQLELYLCSFSFFSWTSDNIRTGFIMAKFKLWKKYFLFLQNTNLKMYWPKQY